MIEITKPDAPSCNCCPSLLRDARIAIKFIQTDSQGRGSSSINVRLCATCIAQLKNQLGAI